MENVSGEELNWFWRGWFMNKWKIDQSVKTVKYVNGDPKNGAQITVENLGKLPMPTTVQIKFKDGSSDTAKIPIEVWKRNTEWTFKVNSTKEIGEVKLDPNGQIPDVNLKNNSWSSAQAAPAEKIEIKDYTGTFGSKEIPLKITMMEKDKKLFAQATGQEAFPLEYLGDNKFNFEMADIIIVFAKDKKSFTITQGGKDIKFTKE